MNLETGLSIDILNLEWPTSDRDLHIVTPILVYLNKKYGLNYKQESIFNGYYYILKYRPRALLISNFSGAIINHETVKVAYEMGIKVISCISEGNVKEEVPEQFLWGWNKDKILYLDKMLLWSERSKNIFLKKYPELKDKLVTTGATGFDRYKILEFYSKSKFLKDNNLKYKKVIGIAGWGFDHYFGDYFEFHKEYFLNTFGKDEIELHRESLFRLQNIYKDLIENNPDILFILRYHPGTINFEKNEFFGLEKYKNVFVSDVFRNSDYQISDLINIADLWIGYETTTAMEAWLLGKQTFLINPIRSDFIRENVHKGSPIVKTSQEAQELIDEYFDTKKIKNFENLQSFREKIIKDVIEYGDGKNCIRAGEEVKKILSLPEKKFKFNLIFFKEMGKQVLKIILSRTIIKGKWKKLNVEKDFATEYQKKYENAINV